MSFRKYLKNRNTNLYEGFKEEEEERRKEAERRDDSMYDHDEREKTIRKDKNKSMDDMAQEIGESPIDIFRDQVAEIICKTIDPTWGNCGYFMMLASLDDGTAKCEADLNRIEHFIADFYYNGSGVEETASMAINLLRSMGRIK